MLSGCFARRRPAVQVNIAIMRALSRMRRMFAAPGEFLEYLRKIAETVELHDGQIKAITEVLQKMMEPPPEPPKRRIGFVTDTDKK